MNEQEIEQIKKIREENYNQIKSILEKVNDNTRIYQSVLFNCVDGLREPLNELSKNGDSIGLLDDYIKNLESLEFYLKYGEKIKNEEKSRNNLLKKLGERN